MSRHEITRHELAALRQSYREAGWYLECYYENDHWEASVTVYTGMLASRGRPAMFFGRDVTLRGAIDRAQTRITDTMQRIHNEGTAYNATSNTES